MADLAVLKASLAKMETRYDDILLGLGVSDISDGDLGSIKYTESPLPAIKLRINELKSQIAALEGTSRGPLYQRFG